MPHYVKLLILILISACTSDRKSAPELNTLDDIKEYFTKTQRVSVRPFSTFDFGRENDSSNISIVVSEKQAKERLSAIRKQLSPSITACLGSYRLHENDFSDSVELIFSNTADQFSILKNHNYDTYTDSLIPTLRKFDTRYGITINRADTDMIQFTLHRCPEDIEGFVNELCIICPELLEFGEEPVKSLQHHISKSKEVYFWWD